MKKIAVFIIMMFFLAMGVFSQQKFALVIGNGAYTGSGMSKLANPVNDANDVSAALQGLGFTVDKILDANLDQMESAIVRLKNRLSVSNSSYGFFFYAGHGVQSGGVNYLIPVGSNIPSENFLRERAVSVQSMLDELNDAGNALNVIVLDACRDNPFTWKRSGTRGLTVVGNQPADSIIVYATSAGSTAADGTGRNGLFTTHLLNNLKTPGLEVKEVFNRTGADVARASNRTQIPAIYSQYFDTAFLGSNPQVATAQTTQPSQPAQSQQTTQPAQTTQPQQVTTQPQQNTQPVQTTQPQQTTQSTSTQKSASVAANMVRIKGGTFNMGSPTNELGRYSDEGPQHKVTVSSFYIGKYEVTQEEYQEIMGTNPSNSKGDNLPVEQVSWYDAIEYCNKRSQKEGLTPAYTRNGDNVIWNRNSNGYRLPTEAEWEYACRAGTTKAYNIEGDYSNGWYGEIGGWKTHPVGQKIANAWGLYDMHGNVLEWCWDWYGNYSSGSQTDPMGTSSGSYRVGRGGSCDSNSPFLVRSAKRNSEAPSYRRFDIGFRLARNIQ